MEMMLELMSSNVFVAFVILAILYNVVRRRNKRVRSLTTRKKNQLKDRIRDRQTERWDMDREDAPFREREDSEHKV
jgi:hypothetical protein